MANQAKNLVALSIALKSDLEALLCEEESSPIRVKEFAAKAQLRSFLKKFEHELSEKADAAALEKFVQVNETCGKWALGDLSEEDRILLGEFRQALYNFYYPRGMPLISNYSEILSHGKTGPGISLGANGNDFYSKLFSSKLTVTSELLYDAYSCYIANHPTFCKANQIRETEYGDFDIVSGNRLSFVPKNVDISRCICIEPSLNMFYQLGVKHILEARLKSFFGIDFSVQQFKNRDMAQLASMFDKQWVTIDLSSASDSMSLRMLEWALPPDFLRWLASLRSPSMTLPNGSQLQLNMISTMGNGFTFPLQTLLFCCVVKAAYKVASVPFEAPRGASLGNFGVYGDDIICRYESNNYVRRLLELLGFTVNADKSYDLGPFRESCGGDFFKGHPVRPFYLKALACPQDAYVAVNRLNRWTALTGIPVCRTVRLLLSWIRRFDNLVYVPLSENDDAGLKVPRRAVSNLMLCPHVQSVKYRAWRAKAQRIRFEAVHYLRNEVVATQGVFGPRHLVRDLMYNPEGLLIAFLNGNIAGGSVSVRHDCVHYQLKSGVIPNWDYIGESDSIALSDCQLPLGRAIDWNTGF